MNKAKFPRISTVLFLVVLATTIFLFFFLTVPETRTSLFTFNLIYVCFLEFLFFGFFAFTQILALSNHKIKDASYPVWGSLISIYIIVGVITVLSYSLYLHQYFGPRAYVSFLLVLTVFAFVSGGFVLKVDRLQSSADEVMQENKMSLMVPLEEIKLLEKKFRRVVEEKGIQIKTESNFSSIIEKLINRLGSIPPTMVERNPGFVSKANEWSGELRNLINQFETEGEPALKGINTFINDCCDFTDSQKNLFRK